MTATCPLDVGMLVRVLHEGEGISTAPPRLTCMKKGIRRQNIARMQTISVFLVKFSFSFNLVAATGISQWIYNIS